MLEDEEEEEGSDSDHHKEDGVKRFSMTKSLTDDDLDELKGCVDLGFGFSYEEIPETCNTLPALELCYSMSQRFMDEQQQRSPSSDSSPTTSEGVEVPLPIGRSPVLTSSSNKASQGFTRLLVVFMITVALTNLSDATLANCRELAPIVLILHGIFLRLVAAFSSQDTPMKETLAKGEGCGDLYIF